MRKVLFIILVNLSGLTFAQTIYPVIPGGLVTVSENCQNGIPLTFSSSGVLQTAQNPGVEIVDECQMTYTANTMIHLRPGFHAGQFNTMNPAGYFRTTFVNAPVVKLVSPDATAIVNGIVQVPKWEKLEIAFKLPPNFEAAVNSFFNNYFDPAAGNQVDPVNDLNPYADDSLCVRVQLTSPSGKHLTRYAFYMREARWGSSGGTVPEAADLESNPSHDLADYHWRFRFAPDEVDISIPWTMKIEVLTKPYSIFGRVEIGTFGFICITPLPDNHGYLHVNQDNNRYLRFDDGTDYLGIGINLGEGRKGYSGEESLRSQWFRMQKLDFDRMNEIITDLAQNGGNEVRLSLNRGSFAFEWENLGVYDEYRTEQLCDPSLGNTGEKGWTGPYPNVGNRQYHAWAFDQILETCHANNVYVQLNLFLAVNYHAYQTYLWGDNAYYKNYVVGNPAPGGLPGWDTKRFFISSPFNNAGSSPMNTGSMYYWKRHFRYLMARWGYSTNIAWLETFNEIDCILRFRDRDLINAEHMCPENQLNFPKETATRDYIKLWHEELIHYAKHVLDNNEASVRTPNHLWSVSYAIPDPTFLSTDPTYYDLYDLPEIDIVDLHSYDFPTADSWPEINKRRFEIINGDDQGTPGFYGRFGKPCCFGEGSTYGKPIYVQNFDGTFKSDERLTRIFQNYKMTFHNMIWSSALSGTCSVVKTWQWENVCWLEEGMPKPLREFGVNNSSTNSLGGINNIQPIGAASQIVPLPNIKLLDQFLPLKSFLTDFNPVSSTSLKYYYNTANHQEGIIHTSGNGVGGWLHHSDKYLDHSYYYTSSIITLTPPSGGNPITIDPDEDFTKCQGSSPFTNTLSLNSVNAAGVTDQTGISYPTFLGQTNLPDVEVISVNQDKVLVLSNHPLTCSYENESVAFIAFSSGNRMKNEVSEEKGSPCLEGVKTDVLAAENIISINWNHEQSEKVNPGNQLQIVVTDLVGRLVLPVQVFTGSAIINTTQLSSGMYSISINSGTCKISKNFIKL